MAHCVQIHRLSDGVGIMLILLVTALPASAQLFSSAIDRLPLEQRVALKKGQPIVVGKQGRFTARILIRASPEVAWAVLTDYRNLPNFMPNVISSKVLVAEGDRKVIEQIEARQVFFMTLRSRTRSAIAETKNQRIDFKQIEGDFQQIQGYWLIESVAPCLAAKPDQVLITQVVEAQPRSGTPKGIFYNVFQQSLTESFNAIRVEVLRRFSKANRSSTKIQ
ncbi:SRPBCC family protein [Phormidesmis sp. 146-33]